MKPHKLSFIKNHKIKNTCCDFMGNLLPGKYPKSQQVLYFFKYLNCFILYSFYRIGMNYI